MAESCAQVLVAALENSTDSRHRSLIDDDFDPDFDFNVDDIEVEGKDDSDGEGDNL